jgi:hypothetical protein
MADTTTTARIKLALEGASAVQQGLNKVETSVASAGKAMLGLAGGLSVAGFAAWVKGAIDAADETSKLAQKTGLAVNQVAGLQLAFRQSGARAEQFVPIMAKLGIAVTNGNKALDAMGVSSRNADGSLKGTRQVLGEVSDKFKGYEDGAAKTALAVGLLGEEGAKLLPFLNQGADGLAAYDEMAQRLGLTLDTNTAKAAEQFNDTLDLIGQSTAGVSRQVAAQLLPTLNTLAGEFFRTLTQGDALKTTVTLLSGAMRGLYAIGVGVVEAFKTVGTALGGVGAAIAAILSGDFGQVRGILSDMSADISSSWLASGASISRAWANAGDSTVAALSASAAAAREGAPAIAEAAKASTAKAAADKAAAAALRERIAAAQSNNAAFDEEFKRIEDVRLATEGRIKSAREMLEAIERETALLGLSNTEREQAIALYELERAGVVKGTEAYKAYADAIANAIGNKNARQATLDAQKKLADAQEKAIEDQQKAYADMWASVDQTAHDVFVNVADEGMDAFKRIGKTLKAAVLDMLYQMTLKKWIFQISGQSSGLGGAGGSGMSLSDISSAYSAASTAFSGGAATAGGSASAVGAWAGGSMSTANAAGSIYANATGTGMNGLLATNGAYGTAGSAGASSGAAMGWLGWAAFIAAAVMGTATLFGRKLKGYGFEANISGGSVDVGGYEYHKGGLFRSNKTVRNEVDSRDAEDLRTKIEHVRSSARLMALAMGQSTAAIDSYTGSLRINLKGADTAAEVSRRYGEALEDLQLKMINAGDGVNYTKESFAKLKDDALAFAAAAGYSADTMAALIRDGMLGRVSASDVGAQMGDMMLDSIYNALAGGFAGQITASITDLIITPLMVAVTTGGNIAAVVNSATMAAVKNQAMSTIAAFRAMINDPEIQAIFRELQGMSTSLGKIVSGSMKVQTSSMRSGYSAAAAAAKSAAEEQKRAAQAIKDAWRDVGDSLIDEIKRIRGEILGATPAGLAYAQSQFAIATAQARAGDQLAAKSLPELSRALIALAEESAGSLSDFRAVQGATLASLQATLQYLGGAYGFGVPAFDVGTNRVPYDMLAMVHKDEAIVPAAYNPAAGGMGSHDDAAIVAELKALRAEVAELKRSNLVAAGSAMRLERIMENVTSGGNMTRVQVVA